MAPDEAEQWRRWRQAAGRPGIAQALTALYDDVDAAVAARNPTCWLSGKCCDFDAYGHRLYVTGLEIAWCLQRVVGVQRPAPSPARRPLPPPGAITADGPCVFQQARMCGIHPQRPFSCRMFFCQAGTESWQHDTYEHFLQRLRRLHDSEAVAYHYMEWRTGLVQALRHLDPTVFVG